MTSKINKPIKFQIKSNFKKKLLINNNYRTEVSDS